MLTTDAFSFACLVCGCRVFLGDQPSGFYSVSLEDTCRVSVMATNEDFQGIHNLFLSSFFNANSVRISLALRLGCFVENSTI